MKTSTAAATAQPLIKVGEVLHGESNVGPQMAEQVFADHPQTIETERTHGFTRIAGVAVEYTYEAPASKKDVTDPVPVLLVPGYGGTESAYWKLRHQITQHGKPAISYQPPRTKGWLQDLHPANSLRPHRLTSQAAYAVVKDVIDSFGHESVDLSGHSMGGKTISDLALHRPELIRSLLYNASVGLDQHTVLQMLGRALICLRRDIGPEARHLLQESENRLAAEITHYVLRNPVRTAGEALVAASCNLERSIQTIRSHGIKTGAIQYHTDAFFPLPAFLNASQHLFDVVHVYRDPHSNHLQPQRDPAGVAKATVEVLHQLNQPHTPVSRAGSSSQKMAA